MLRRTLHPGGIGAACVKTSIAAPTRLKRVARPALFALDGMPRPDREGSVLSISKRGFHRMAYVEWGDPKSTKVAVCVHGLSRQGRDFDLLAAALADRGWRVVCPDLPGRGRSDWLQDPEEYTLPQYAMDLTVLISRLGVDQVDWIGTSLGGLIGIVLAGHPKAPIKRLVMNDVGPFLPWQALQRLGNSVRVTPESFPSLPEASAYLQTRLANFGKLTEEQWLHLTRHSVSEQPNGSWRRLSDPDIIAAFRPGWYFNLSLWTYWDAITCPTLVLRGVDSDVLLPATVTEMHRRGPGVEVVEIPECGHAPALLDPSHIAPIVDWLA
jgi:pimeloyl-ACP methyl ester carboxylesterase